jgi:hypothetical protein
MTTLLSISVSRSSVFTDTLDLMSRGRINPSPVLTHRFPVGQVKDAFDLVQSRDKSAIGIVLTGTRRKCKSPAHCCRSAGRSLYLDKGGLQGHRGYLTPSAQREDYFKYRVRVRCGSQLHKSQRGGVVRRRATHPTLLDDSSEDTWKPKHEMRRGRE